MTETITIILILVTACYFCWKSKCKHCGSHKDVIHKVCDKCWCKKSFEEDKQKSPMDVCVSMDIVNDITKPLFLTTIDKETLGEIEGYFNKEK